MNRNSNQNLVPAGDIAREAGYTPDYITRLAREKKIKGKKVGKKWLVDPESVADLVQRKKEEKEIRSKALRRERKKEQLHHSKHTSPIDSVKSFLVKDANLKSVKPKKASVREHVVRVVPKYFDIGSLAKSMHAVVATSGIMLAGVLVGVVTYMAPTTTEDVLSRARAFDTVVFIGHIGEDIFGKGQMIAGTFSGMMDDTLARITPRREQYAANVFWSDVWCGFKSLVGKECFFESDVSESPTIVVEDDIEQPIETPITDRVVQPTTVVTTPTIVAPTTVTNPVAVYTYDLPDIFPSKWLDQVTSKEVHVYQTGGNMRSIEDLSDGVFTRFNEISEHFTTNLLDVNGNVNIDGRLTVTDFIATSTITTYSSVETPFITATSTTATSTFAGGLAVETTGFVYDFASNKVGIGTANPETRLTLVQEADALGGGFRVNQFGDDDYFEIVGIADRVAFGLNGSELFSFTETGRIGIGTSSPTYALEVIGDGRFTSSVDATYFTATSTTATSTFAGGLVVDVNGFVYDYATNRVGIGTTSPFVRLAVAGDAYIDGTLIASTNVETPYFVATDTIATSTFAGGVVIDINGFVYDYASNHIGLNTTNTQSLLTLGNTTSIISTDTLDGSDSKRIQIGGGGATEISRGAFISLMGNEYGGEAGDLSFYAGDSGVLGQGALRFFTGNLLERLTITAAGNVGIGTTSPAQHLSVAGHGYLTGGFGIGVSTTTPGVLQTSGNGWIGGNLVVVGDSTVFGDSTTLGESSADTLVINSSIGSDLIPTINATYDIGSPSFFWDDGFFDTITANNISAASSSISGTQSETFTINSNNATADTESMDLIFFRGTVVPNALISWNAVLDKFDFNQPLFIQNDSATTTIRTLDVWGSAGQTADLFRVASSSGTSVFNILANGNVGIGTTTPGATFGVAGSGLFEGTLTASNLVATSSISVPAFTATNATTTNFAVTSLTQGRVPFIGVGGLLLDSASFTFDGTSLTSPVLAASSATGTSTFAGGIAVETSGFVYDYATNRVGIGTAVPDRSLHVFAGDSGATPYSLSQLVVENSGRAGIDILSGSSERGLLNFGDSGNAQAGVVEYDHSGDFMRFVTNGSEKLRISSTGNVGIGTISPAAALDIYGKTQITSGGVLTWGNANDAGRLSWDTGRAIVQAQAGNRLALGSNAEQMTISTAGNVGIGTTTPGTLLQLSSVQPILRLQDNNNLVTDNAYSSYIQWHDSVGTQVGLFGYSSGSNQDLQITNTVTGGDIGLSTQGTRRMTIDSLGNIGIGTTTPAFKFDVQDSNAVASRIYGTNTQATLLRFANLNSATQWNIGAGGSSGWSNNNFVIDQQGIGNRFVISNTGNVGIGTTTPGARLQVTAASGELLRINRSGTNAILSAFGTSDAGDSFVYLTGDGGSSQLQFRDDGTLTYPTGRVGIGTTTPSEKLEVHEGDIAISNGYYLRGRRSSDNQLVDMIGYATGTNDLWIRGSTAIHFASTGGELMTIRYEGNVGIGEVTPDAHLEVSANGSTGGNIFLLSSDDNNDGDILTVTEAGNVGIGTTNPDDILTVTNDGSTQDVFVVQAGNGSSEFRIRETGTDDLALFMEDSSGSTAIQLTADSSNNYIANGNVGIGTTNPTSKLFISSTGDTALTIEADSDNSGENDNPSIVLRQDGNQVNGILGVAGDAGGLYTGALSNATFIETKATGGNDLQFVTGGTSIGGTNGTARMTILRDGNVGIGTTSPYRKLSVSTTGSNDRIAAHLFNNTTGTSGVTQLAIESDGHTAYFSSGGISYTGIGVAQNAALISGQNVGLRASNAGGVIKFATGGDAERMRIDATGNVGIGDTTPAGKLVVQNGSVIDPASGANLIVAESTANNGISILNGNTAIGSIYFGDTDDSFVGGLRYNHSSDQLDVYVNNGDARMSIDSSGNVGIGTVSPIYDLQVGTYGTDADSTLALAAATTGTGSIRFGDGTAGVDANAGKIIYDHSNNSLALHTSATERLRIDSSGNVGIGTTNPGAALHIEDSGFSTTYDTMNGIVLNASSAISQGGYTPGIGFFGTNLTTQKNAGIAGVMTGSDLNQLGLAFFTHPSTVGSADLQESMRIDHDGNVGIGTTSPTAKLEVSDGNILINNTSGLLGFAQGSIERTRISMLGAGTNGGSMRFFTKPDAGSLTEAMRIDSSGNVGIGVTNPFRLLEVSGVAASTRGAVRIEGAANQDALLELYGDRDWYIQNDGNASLGPADYFHIYDVTSAASRLTIDTSGNVGIGTTTPTYGLELHGTTAAQSNIRVTSPTTNPGIILDSQGTTGGTRNWAIQANSTSFGDLVFRQSASLGSDARNGNVRMIINPSGNVGIGTTAPQDKLHIAGNILLSAGAYGLESYIGGTAYTLIERDTSDNGINIGFNTASQGAIDIITDNGVTTFASSGNVGIGETNPDTALHILYASPSQTAASLTPSDLLDLGMLIEDSSIDNNDGEITTGIALGYKDEATAAIIAVDEGGSGSSGFGIVTGNNSAVAERLRVDSSGNVGIGTTSPSTRLHVEGTSTFYGAGSAVLDWGNTSGLGRLTYSGSNPVITALSGDLIIARTSGLTETARFTSSGRLGLGTTNPTGNLHIESSTSDNEAIRIENTNADAAGSRLNIVKDSASAANDDVLGTLGFWGDDSTGTETQFANIFALSSNISNGSEEGELRFRTYNAGSFSDRMTIKGNSVGIGTTTPQVSLHVVGDGLIIDRSSGQPHVIFQDDSVNRGAIYTNSDGDLRFWSGASGSINERLTIQNDGKVGIGTTDPEELLNVFGTNAAVMAEGNGITKAGFKIKTNNTLRWDINSPSGSSNLTFDNSSGDSVLKITQSGRVGIGTATDPAETLEIRQDNDGADTSLLIVNESATDSTDETAEIRFALANNLDRIAKIVVARESNFSSAGNADSSMRFFNSLNGTPTEQLTIANSGNVGIGDTSPGSKLEIANNNETDGATIRLTNSYIAGGWVDSGDVIGDIDFYADDGPSGSPGTVARIRAEADGISAGNFVASAGLSFHTSVGSTLTERVRIDESGNVGIGTTTPQAKLHTFSNVATNFIMERDTSNQWAFLLSGGSLQIQDRISPEVRMVIDSSGDVGIGTTDPSMRLTVQQDNTSMALSNGGQLSIRGDSDTNKRLNIGYQTTGNYGWLQAGINGTGYSNLILNPNGSNVGIGTTSPITKLHIDESGDGYSDTLIGGSSIVLRSSSGANKVSIQGAGISYFDAGNVGIGTTSPYTKLAVQNTNSYVALGDIQNRFVSTGTANLTDFLIVDKDNSNTRAALQVQGNGGAIEVLFAASGGNVGIGTTNPAGRLDVRTDDADDENLLVLQEDADTDPGPFYFELSDTGISGLASKNMVIRGSSSLSDIAFSPSSDTPGALVIKDGGNIGIGTTNPSSKLQVLSTTTLGGGTSAANALLNITDGTASMLFDSNEFVVDNDSLYIGAAGDASGEGNIVFRTVENGSTVTEKARITGAGNVGIGTTTPQKRLTVQNTGSFYPIQWQGSAATFPGYLYSDSGGAGFTFGSEGFTGVSKGAIYAGSNFNFYLGASGDYNFRDNSNNEIFTIESGGDVGIGDDTPDSRLDVESAESGNYAARIYNTHATAGQGLLVSAGDSNSEPVIRAQDKDFNNLFSVMASGNVGIGTVSPGEKLHILGSGTAVSSDGVSSLIVQKSAASGTASGISVVSGNAAVARLSFGDTDAHGRGSIEYDNATDKLLLRTSTTARMAIDSSGNVGIGTTSPSATLAVEDSLGSGGDSLNINNNFTVRGDGVIEWGTSATQGFLSWDSGNVIVGGRSGNDLRLAAGGNEAMRIDTSGRVIVGHTSVVTGPTGLQPQLQVSGTSLSGSAMGINRFSNNAFGGYLAFSKSRSASIGGATAVMEDDVVGTITFGAADGTDLQSEIATIRAEIDGAVGSNDVPGRLVFATTPDGSAAPTERMRITSSGYVGIGGTPVGDTNLHILSDVTWGTKQIIGNTTTGLAMLILDAGNGDGVGGDYFYIRQNNDLSAVIKTDHAGGSLTLGAGGDDSITIIDGGNVGIGTTTPLRTFSLQGDAAFSNDSTIGNMRFFTDATGYTNFDGTEINYGQNFGIYNYESTGSIILGAGGGGSDFVVAANNNIGIGTSTPDSLLNIVGADPVLLIKDTATATAGAVASVRFAESATGGITDNYWDVGVPTAGAFSFGVEYNGSQKLTVDTSGRVGIGISSSLASTLTVQGSLCVRDTGTCGTTAGTIYATNASVTDIDLAENYPTIDDTIAAGEIVTLDPYNNEYIKRASYGDTPFGIISTAPGITLGGEDLLGKPVALKGRVPVKVNLEGGDIVVGDRITLSQSEPGVGTKAVESTRTIGIALEPFNAASEEDTIMVAVENEYTFVPNDFALKSENTGFGTTSPYAKLAVVNDSTSPSFIVEDSTGGDTTPFIVDTDGKVGIGTSTPSAQLHTTGSVRFENFGAGALQTDANGNLTVSSDERLKDIEGSFNRGLEEIRELEPIMYRWNEFSGFERETVYAGFSAQNVQAGIPEAVGQDKYGFLTLADRPILAAAVNAIKELDLDLQSLADEETFFADAEGDSFTARFLGNLRQWFADTANGIGSMIAGTFQATEQLCINDTCVSEEQLQQLLDKGTTSVVPDEEPDTDDDEHPSSGGGNTNTGTTTDETATTTDDGADDVATSTDDGTDVVEEEPTTDETATSTEDGSEETETVEEPVEEEVVEETPEEEDPIVEEPEPEPEPEPTPEPEPETAEE